MKNMNLKYKCTYGCPVNEISLKGSIGGSVTITFRLFFSAVLLPASLIPFLGQKKRRDFHHAAFT